MEKEVLDEAEQKMKKSNEALRRELATLRTGRASTALVDRLVVEYYGTPTPLNQLASVTAPEPRLLVIQPWDKSGLAAIEKAILKSDLGLTPTNDGRIIRLAIPYLTEERRRELVKVVKGHVEEAKVAIRNIRRDAVGDMKALEQEKMISEDQVHRAQEKIQEITDHYTKEAEAIGVAKEHEILEV